MVIVVPLSFAQVEVNPQFNPQFNPQIDPQVDQKNSPLLKPLFGTEFTFTNPEIIADFEKSGDEDIVNSDIVEKFQHLFAKKLRDVCAERKLILKKTLEELKRAQIFPGCKVVTVKNSYGVKVFRVIYEDGWWFQIATDPAVVETQTKPSTRQEIIDLKERIQQDLFEAAKSVGLTPHKEFGGGHIHMDFLTSFQSNALLFRNFLVDIVNHPHLGLGILDDDPHNAAPVALLKMKSKQSLVRTIKEFDCHYKSGQRDSIESLVNKILENVYNTTYSKGYEPAQKYHMLNLSRLTNKKFKESEKTIELRGIRAQNNIGELIQEMTLFESRLNYLEQQFANRFVPLKMMKVQYPTRSKNILVEEFHEYVCTQGLNFKSMVELLPTKLQAIRRTRDYIQREDQEFEANKEKMGGANSCQL